MTFGEVLDDLKAAAQPLYARRRGWNATNQYLALQVPDTDSKMTLPYLYLTTVQGDRVPWLASQTDMLSDDWEIVSHVEDFDEVAESDEAERSWVLDRYDDGTVIRMESYDGGATDHGVMGSVKVSMELPDGTAKVRVLRAVTDWEDDHRAAVAS